MGEDRYCINCVHYDPDEGVCEKTAEYMHGYDGDSCEMWEDWENQFYGGRHR